MKLYWFWLILFGASLAFGAPPLMTGAVDRSQLHEGFSLEDFKMQHRFGIGVSVAGPLSMIGIEADVNIQPEWSISGGLGTGLDYSTFMLKSRHVLVGKSVSPYLAWGFARWWSKGTASKEIGPAILKNVFLDGESDYSKGFDCWIFYPAIGVEYLHTSGFSLFLEAYYMFRLFKLSNGVYAGMGMHWYL